MSSSTLLDGAASPQTTVAPKFAARPFGVLPKLTGTTGSWVLGAAFVLALLPYVVSPVLMYPDEPQYLDAGVFMCQTGDWLMPANPNDAAPKDIKPIFTYWVVALSYSLFGTSLAAARLPYLLAGVGVLWLTYRLALMLTDGSRPAAALSCALLLCNPIFWLSAMRCIPDIWLCLFLLMSAYGFLGLLALESPSFKHAMLAYVGVGLAALAKGVPALLFLGFVGAFVCHNPWRPYSWRRLIHGPSMVLGTAVAISWFVIVFFTHGTDNLKLLWSDQVSTRVQLDPWTVASRFPIALGAVVLAYLPLCWPVWKMGSRWRNVLPASERQRVAFPFIVLWAVVNVLAMTGTITWYVRYLLPAFPLLAVLFGITLAKVDADILGYCMRRFLTLTVAGLGIFFTAVFILSAQMGLAAWEIAAGLVPVVVVGLAAAAGLRGSWLRSAQAIALSLLLAMPVTYFSARNIARPDLEEQFQQRLQVDNADTPVVGFAGTKGTASRLRLALGPRVTLLQWEIPPASAPVGSSVRNTELPAVLVLPTQWAAELPAGKYAVQHAGSVFNEPEDEEVFRAICQGRLGEFLLQNRVAYSIAVRVDSTRTARLSR